MINKTLKQSTLASIGYDAYEEMCGRESSDVTLHYKDFTAMCLLFDGDKCMTINISFTEPAPRSETFKVPMTLITKF